MESHTGPGSQLWRMLAHDFGLDHKPNCPCVATARQMNEWGASGCRAHRAELVALLREARELYSWRDHVLAAVKGVASGAVRYLNPLDPFGSLIDEAIRRGETFSDPNDP